VVVIEPHGLLKSACREIRFRLLELAFVLRYSVGPPSAITHKSASSVVSKSPAEMETTPFNPASPYPSGVSASLIEADLILRPRQQIRSAAAVRVDQDEIVSRPGKRMVLIHRSGPGSSGFMSIGS